jgi:hypothetical protein
VVLLLFGPVLAEGWDCIMGGLQFEQNIVKAGVPKPKSVCFRAGQPLGLYSSWAVLAFSHHVLVWLAAEQVRPSATPFQDKSLVMMWLSRMKRLP